MTTKNLIILISVSSFFLFENFFDISFSLPAGRILNHVDFGQKPKFGASL